MKKFWFFDLDGTLADTDGDIRIAWKAALAELGVDCPRFDRDFGAGPPIEEMAKTLMPETYTDAFGAELRRLFGIKYDTGGLATTREYEGVMDAVRRIASGGGRVFVLTNKRYAGALAIAEKFGWSAVFEKIYAGDMHADDPAVGKMKKPALLAFAMRELGATPQECAMVGDTANDFNAARENGVESVGVSWGYGRPDELALADRIARVPAEIA